MELEDQEREIEMQMEPIIYGGGGGAVDSVNGMTGDVILTTSDIENTSDYQNSTEVNTAINEALDNFDTGFTILTDDDVNYTDPESGEEFVAIWLLPSGRYLTDKNMTKSIATFLTEDDGLVVIGESIIAEQQPIIQLFSEGEGSEPWFFLTRENYGGVYSVNYDTGVLVSRINFTSDFVGDDGGQLGEGGLVPAPGTSPTPLFLSSYGGWIPANFVALTDENAIYEWDGTNYIPLWELSTGYYVLDEYTTAPVACALETDSGGNVIVNPELTSDTRPIITVQRGVSTLDISVVSAQDSFYCNVSITGDLNEVIYFKQNDFVGTDGNNDGTAGLVPAPTTSDAGKFLKSDGTWDTAGGGGGPTVVQAIGTSTADVMSQNAVTGLLFNSARNFRVQIGNSAITSSDYAISIGASSYTSDLDQIAIGRNAGFGSSGQGTLCLGRNSSATGIGAIALGAKSKATAKGEMNIGSVGDTGYGYNNSNYRLLSGLYDGQNAHDAVNKGQLDSISIQNAGAPTTSTVGKVGQLLQDTTNGKLYICTDATNPYVWEEVGAGGGGSVNVVQTTGTSTTDVMSQNAITSMIFADPAVGRQVRIGSTGNVSNNAIRIGYGGQSSNSSAVSIGSSAQATGQYSVALGPDTLASHRGSVALGSSAQTTVKGQIMVGTTNTYDGYNSTNYRIISGVHDGQNAQDAVTVNQVNATIDAINTALSTNIPHIGA